MKKMIIPVMALCILSVNTLANNTEQKNSLEALLESVQSQNISENKAHKIREKRFLADKNKAAKMLSEAKSANAKTKNEMRRLKALFAKNEKLISDTQEQLRLSTGNLGELFGVVRQVSGDASGIIENALTSIDNPGRQDDLAILAKSKVLPNVSDLKKLWITLQSEMTSSAQVKQFDGQYINTEGERVNAPITRIGNFVVFNQEGYLEFDAKEQHLLSLPIQPDGAGNLLQFWQQPNAVVDVLIDPSRGTLMSLLKESPDLIERIKQGGLIGYIIMSLGALGAIIALWRFIYLNAVTSKVNAQLKDVKIANKDNPLGRVLEVYEQQKTDLDLDSLERRIDETILKEIPALEKGNSFIKLLAGIAPLLGLLGTVTGMIATFQAITLFGSGDPKLMAGGISSALITTVLGLVVAIPLLFLHTSIHARSRHLIQLLDQQSAGLVASAIESNSAGK